MSAGRPALAAHRSPGSHKRSLRLPARIHSLAFDRIDAALCVVFLLVSTFFVWRAAYAEPFDLYGSASSQYNQLADAFLHFHLWVVHVPAGVLGHGNPYNPAQRPAFLFAYPDYSLYGQYLYITWGPAPVVVLLLPLHLLGFEPSASVISTPFAVVGLGFALATLRAVLRRIGDVSLWMCVLAALTLACASVVPYIVRFPLVYHEAIAGGYCFAMIALWCVVSSVASGHASLKRLALLSLCIGLATDSRPTLGLLALLVVPVYLALRSTRSRRGLLVALLAPFGVCILLLAAYNQARFGNPLEYGTKYEINGISTYQAHFGELGFLAPGLWSYLFAPPRLSVLFPFLLINYPQVSYPFGLPAHYASISEETGGLLTMAPIVVFLGALPWIWLRRPTWLRSLAPLMLVMACVGALCMTFLAYEFYQTTERYEADYMTLFLLGALTTWLILSSKIERRGRRLIRVGGALLAVWSCLAGMATSYQELISHPGTWHTLVDAGAPVSTVIATVVGHPVIAEIYTSDYTRSAPNYGDFGTEVTGFSLIPGGQSDITIVSPDRRESALVATAQAGPALRAGQPLAVRVTGPGPSSHTYRVLAGNGQARIPVRLSRGVNQLELTPGASSLGETSPTATGSESEVLMTFTHLGVAGR
jgi:hypothetical protein